MAIAQSIDRAANNYVRHRFLRALGASVLVAFVVIAFAMVVDQAITTLLGQSNGWRPDIFYRFSVLSLYALILTAIAVLIGAIVDLLHRRLVALALLAGVVVAGFWAGVGLIFGGAYLLGFQTTMNMASARAVGISSLVAMFILYEVLRAAWWQLTSSNEHFFAVRGMRAAPWRIIPGMRRRLGIPSFLAQFGRGRFSASVFYLGVAALNVGLIGLLLFPLLSTIPMDRIFANDQRAMAIAAGLLLVLNFFGAGVWLSRHAARHATNLYQGVREWDARAPVLFLRAFDQDASQLNVTGGDMLARWPAGIGGERTLDEMLLEHASPYGPVIAIGDPRTPTPPLGAARIFVQGEGVDWQETVRDLAGAAKCIILCPNNTEGVKWELDLIAGPSEKSRTIFLASPELARADTLALFQRLVPEMPELDAKQWPVAAFADGKSWRVLTARSLGVDSYTTALNTALQAMFGLAGVPLMRKPKIAGAST